MYSLQTLHDFYSLGNTNQTTINKAKTILQCFKTLEV